MKKTQPSSEDAFAASSASHELVRLLGSQDEIDRQTSIAAKDDFDKLSTLAEHYAIPDDPLRYYLLALAFAREFVPGFLPKAKRGRKSKWSPMAKGLLMIEVERLLEKNPAKSIAWASNQLAKREPWRSFVETKESGAISPDPGETLRKTYFDFRGSRASEMFRAVYPHIEALQGLPGWEAEILKFVEK